MDRSQLDVLTGELVDAAIKVHSALGPGLLESAYEACLAHEISKRRIAVVRQPALPIVYDGVQVDTGYRLDLVVDNAVIIELKTVEKLLPIHRAQLLSYLKFSGLKVGFLMNFHSPRVIDGIQRIVSGL